MYETQMRISQPLLHCFAFLTPSPCTLIHPPWRTQLSTLSFPIISALCYFPALCKWHWLDDVNSHSTEEMSQSFCVPNSDGSSITKATNTHYTPITDHHSNNCNSTQSCRKAHSRKLHSVSRDFQYSLFLRLQLLPVVFVTLIYVRITPCKQRYYKYATRITRNVL